jgi:hypothetical protein
VTSGREWEEALPAIAIESAARAHYAHPPIRRIAPAKEPTMWILAEAPKGSNFYEAQSQAGNKVLISDSCETVIYARSQGSDGHRSWPSADARPSILGPPVRGAETDMTAQMLDLARQLQAVMPT